jgi:hypothetical protein
MDSVAQSANFGLFVQSLSEQYVTHIIEMPFYASLKQLIYNFCVFIAKLDCLNFAEQFGKKLTFRNSVGQFFAAEGHRIEGPPPKDVFCSFP